MVRSVVTRGAAGRGIRPDTDVGQRPDQLTRVHALDVLQPLTVAALALDVVISAVFHGVPSLGPGRLVALLVYRVTLEAEVLRAGAGCQSRIGLGMPGLDPG